MYGRIIKQGMVTAITFTNLIISLLVMTLVGGTDPIIIMGMALGAMTLPFLMDVILKGNVNLFIYLNMLPVVVGLVGVVHLWGTGVEPAGLTAVVLCGSVYVIWLGMKKDKAKACLWQARNLYLS
jgi:hypothetical protein